MATSRPFRGGPRRPTTRDRLRPETLDRALAGATPAFYIDRIKRDLGSLWNFLPPGALEHDPEAFLAKQTVTVPLTSRRASD